MAMLFDKEKIVITEETIELLFHQHFEAVCTFLSYYTHDQDLIEDISQDIFIKLWEDRDTVNIFFIKTYLYTAARNRMLNYLRNEHNRSVLAEKWALSELEKQKASDCVNMDEFYSVYEKAVDTLPAVCRDIFNMSKRGHKTYREIAFEKGLSVKTVEAQMSIALKKIRSYITLYYRQPGRSFIQLSLLMTPNACLIVNELFGNSLFI